MFGRNTQSNDCIALLSERSHSVFSGRYEQPDPISLPSERTHGDRDVVNQSDGKPELGTPIPPFHFLPLSLFLPFFRTPFYPTSDFHATLVCFLPSVHFRPARLVIASVQMTIRRSGQIAIINGIGFAASGSRSPRLLGNRDVNGRISGTRFAPICGFG